MIGTVLRERYEITEQIGEGGMSHVYLAYDYFLERYVALKVIKRETLNESAKLEEIINSSDIVINLSGANIINRWTQKYKNVLERGKLYIISGTIYENNPNSYFPTFFSFIFTIIYVTIIMICNNLLFTIIIFNIAL